MGAKFDGGDGVSGRSPLSLSLARSITVTSDREFTLRMDDLHVGRLEVIQQFFISRKIFAKTKKILASALIGASRLIARGLISCWTTTGGRESKVAYSLCILVN
jgi:hypothetical protein